VGCVKGQKRLHLQVREADEHEQEDRTARTALEEEPGTTTLVPAEHASSCAAPLERTLAQHQGWGNHC
jgi:hypothetical protein